jgi:hypothetical protein
MINVKGKWFISLFGPKGELKEKHEGKNVITLNGLSGLVSHLVSATAAATTFTFRYIAIGTDATGEANTDTALGGELTRHTGTVSHGSNGIYRVTATFPSGTGTGAIAEYGVLDSNAAGTLFSRDTEAVVNKGANDDLVVTTEITFS